MLTSAISLALFTGSVLAKSTSDIEKVERIDVWGTKVESSSVYLGDDHMQLVQADHLSDLLRDIPGVDVGGTHSTNQRIYIRGLDDTDLNVTIDGARQNNYMYHHMGNLLVNADNLKAVEIQVGSTSVIHGGLGGSVVFETKDAKDLLSGDEAFGARVMVGHNTNASNSTSLTAFGKLSDSTDFLFYSYYLNRDNIENGNGINAIGDDGDILNGLGKIGFDLTDEQRLEISYDSYLDKGDYVWRADMGSAANAAITGDKVYEVEYDRKTLTAVYELNLGRELNLRATAYNNESELYRLENVALEAESTGTSTNSGFNILANSILNFSGFKHNFNYGLEYRSLEQQLDRMNVPRRPPTAPAPTIDDIIMVEVKEESNNFAYYAEDRITLVEGTLFVTPGIRLDDYEKTDANGLERSWDNVSKAIALEWQPNDSVSFSLSSTELFKGPELTELFVGLSAMKIDNSDLVPEEGRNDEFSIRFDTTNLFSEDYLTANIRVFKTNIENKIVLVDYPHDQIPRGGPLWDQNIGDVELDGIELSVLYDIANVNFLATYSTTDTEQLSTGNPLDRESGDRFGLKVQYDLSDYGLSLNWGVQVVKDQKELEKEGYSVHNISAIWQGDEIVDGLSITFGVDNLFDKAYVSHASRTGTTTHPVFGFVDMNDFEPGRNIKLTAAYTF